MTREEKINDIIDMMMELGIVSLSDLQKAEKNNQPSDE